MLAALAYIYVALIYIRPGELDPSLAGVPFAQIVGGLGLAVAALNLLRGQDLPLINLDLAVLVFVLAALVSNPAHGWFGGILLPLDDLIPAVATYVFVRVGFRTMSSVRRGAALVCVLTLLLAAHGLIEWKTGIGFGGATAVNDRGTIRIRGLGIFNDPNDLGMALVLSLPLLTALCAEGIKRRALWLLGTPIIIGALYLTNSRGSTLGLGAALLTWLYRRKRGVRFVPVAAVALVAIMALAPSRTEEMSADEDSAQGRIAAWSAGLGMLRSAPVFGVGYAQFLEHHERVAHNSFVHTAAELGLVGAFALVLMEVSFFAAVASGANADRALADGLIASGVGVAVCCWFLSRQYVGVPYLLFGLGGAYAGAAGVRRQHERNTWRIAAVSTGGLLAAVYVVVNLLGSWR